MPSYAGNHAFSLKGLPGYDVLAPFGGNALDSLMALVKLSNDAALVSPRYTNFVSTFLLRGKEALWEMLDDEEFRKDWCYDEPDKEVVFLFVANFDLGNVSKWKELIPYYNLEGTHILASQELTADINKVTQMKRYPSYIIIKKDGSFELSKAGYPMNRKKLIQQIEAAL